MMTAPPPAAPIQDAASVILLRRDRDVPHVLMGQRGARAVFMPSKYVFPGGAVDPGDHHAGAIDPAYDDPRLSHDLLPESRISPPALLACARRELTEETGLLLNPETRPLFVFRAITPPGLPRRFDARFFVCESDAVLGDVDDFSAACDELSHLQWVPVPRARGLALPFITEVVLAEVAAMIHAAGEGPLSPPETVPFFDNRGPEPRFLQIS